MTGLIIELIIIVAIALITISANNSKKKHKAIIEKDHEWHLPKGEYAQNHADRIDNRLINHPEPEPGYVVLNGVKRKIEDCKNL